MAKKEDPKTFRKRVDPDQNSISNIQATRLSELSGIPVEKIEGRTFAELNKDLRWHIDPQLIFFKHVCGQVVRRNPETGELEGVPNATVHVEDTDCSFMIYSPPDWPHWSWFFPFHCRREELTSVVTDECGHFCVWIPAWEIDWIARWREARICFPTIYRPRLKDYLERILLPELLPYPPRVKPPRPHDPPLVEAPRPAEDPRTRVEMPSSRLDAILRRPEVLERMRAVVDDDTFGRIEALAEGGTFGAPSMRLQTELESPVIPLPPPLPKNLDPKETRMAIDAGLTDDMRAQIGTIDLDRWIGPFWRCRDILIGLWTPVFDVPDITFRVTQDIDDDGTEEPIYSEGFFDVRWDSPSLSNVILEADASALSTPMCHGPEIDPTDCTGPTILHAGLMPLQGPYFDTTTGYARFVNRARSGGTSGSTRDTATESPVWRTVQLHGCLRFEGAVHYRLVKRYEGGGAFSPILGETWTAPRDHPGPPFHVVPDAQGWYEILPEDQLAHPLWLLNWRTWREANGRYDVKLQLSDSSKSIIDESAPMPLQIDNSRPTGVFTLVEWRYAGFGGWTPLPHTCPVIRRMPGEDIQIRATCEVSAAHYRNAILFGRSCNGTALNRLDPDVDYDNWHTAPNDNSWTTIGRFLVGHEMENGAYTIGINVNGRAFNPAGGDSGPSSDWDYDWVYSWAHPRRHIAIVDL